MDQGLVLHNPSVGLVQQLEVFRQEGGQVAGGVDVKAGGGQKQ